MLKTTLIQNIIWYSNPVLLLATAIALYARGQHRIFPWFCAYLIFVAAKTYSLLVIFDHSRTYYFYCFWLTDVLSIGLSFLVLYEVFRNVMTEGTLAFSKSTFAMIAAILLLLAATAAVLIKQNDSRALIRIILTLLGTVRFVQIGLMLVLVVLSVFFGYYWGNLAFGITAGFALYAAMETAGVVMRDKLGLQGSHDFALVREMSYQMASFIWLAYALKRPKLPSIKLPDDKELDWSQPIKRIFE